MASIKIRFLHEMPDAPGRPGDIIEVDPEDSRVREWLQNRQAEQVPEAEQLPAETPSPVKVKALQWHTTQGETHEVGDIYDAAAELVDTLRAQGKAVPEGEAPIEPPPAEPPPA